MPHMALWLLASACRSSRAHADTCSTEINYTQSRNSREELELCYNSNQQGGQVGICVLATVLLYQQWPPQNSADRRTYLARMVLRSLLWLRSSLHLSKISLVVLLPGCRVSSLWQRLLRSLQMFRNMVRIRLSVKLLQWWSM